MAILFERTYTKVHARPTKESPLAHLGRYEQAYESRSVDGSVCMEARIVCFNHFETTMHIFADIANVDVNVIKSTYPKRQPLQVPLRIGITQVPNNLYKIIPSSSSFPDSFKCIVFDDSSIEVESARFHFRIANPEGDTPSIETLVPQTTQADKPPVMQFTLSFPVLMYSSYSPNEKEAYASLIARLRALSSSYTDPADDSSPPEAPCEPTD